MSPAAAGPDGGLRPFLLVWTCETLSILGSALTGFAVGVWAYQTTGSVTAFAMISLAVVAPSVVAMPAAGALVDRWDRRRVMILGDLGAGAGTLVLALLFAAGRPGLATVCLVLVACSVFATLQTLAFTASTRLLVPDRHLERANGMAHLGASAARIVAPLAAGFLTETIGVHGVILIDVATLVLAVGILAFVRIPSPRPAEPRPAGWGALAAEARQGLSYVTERPGLLGLLLLFAAANLSFGMVQTLLSPLVLSFGSASDLGVVLSVTGFGMLGGGLLMVWRGVPRGRTVRTVLALTALQGALLLLGGARPSLGLVAGAAAVYVFCIPVVASSSLALWQRKVPAALHGRVFALTRMVSMSAFPVAYLAAGPLADRVFEPLLAPDGALADSVGAVIGVGPGRGIGLLFVLLGCLTVAATAVARGYRPLRRLEAELPDVEAEAAPSPAPVTAPEGASRMVP